MPSGRSTVIDVTYDDPRTGERVRERKIQEIPYEELEGIRNRELALVTAPRTTDPAQQQITRYKDDQYNDNDNDDDDNYYTVRRRRTQEYTRDRAPYTSRTDVYERRPARRRSYDARSSRSDSEEEDSSRDRRRHRKRESSRRRTRTRSRQPSPARSSTKNSVKDNPAYIQDQEDDGILWYSGKKRSEANFYEKNFDSSYDGILAAAAGAAMGVVTARHYAGDKNKTAKTLGAAAVGAVAFNAGENWFRIFTEEREEKKEVKERRQGVRE